MSKISLNTAFSALTKLNDWWVMVKDNFLSIATGHNALEDRVDNIVASSGTSSTEIVDARHSVTKNKTFPVLTDRLEETETEVTTHTAENVSYSANLLRDTSLSGTQIISGLPFRPKHINIQAIMNGGTRFSIGNWAESGNQGCLIFSGGTIGATPFNTIFIVDAIGGSNHIVGTISNITDTSFDITWVKSGTPPVGTMELIITIGGHQ